MYIQQDNQQNTSFIMPSLALLGISTLFLCHCVEPANSDLEPDQIEPVVEDRTGLELASSSFGEDPQEIGPDWYDYEPRTHVLTPKPVVYKVLDEDEPLLLFEVTSYYDDKGESGTFSLQYKLESDPQTAHTLTLPSVKEGTACLDQHMAITPCESEDTLLVFRIASRVLPTAGFSVNEPGIYIHQPFRGERTSPRYTVEHIGAESVNDTSFDANGIEAPSSFLPSHSRVGWVHPSADDLTARQDIYLHATSTMHIAQWQVASITQEGSDLDVHLKITCQKLDPSGDMMFDMSTTQTIPVSLSTATSFDGALIQLCDPEQPSTATAKTLLQTDEPLGALLPHEQVDLYLEQHQGRTSIKLAPGTLLLNWTHALGMGSTEMHGIELPPIWQDYLAE